MKQVPLLVTAAIMALSVGGGVTFSARGADDESAPIFGIKIPPGYRAWSLISVAHEEGNLNDLRAILGNDVGPARLLVARGVNVSEVFHREVGGVPQRGPDPTRRSYASYATFSDPDGNEWLLQEVTARLPGRVDADDTTFTSSTELASALRRAAVGHGEHEKRIGQRDAEWPNWYAEYIVREQAGKALLS